MTYSTVSWTVSIFYEKLYLKKICGKKTRNRTRTEYCFDPHGLGPYTGVADGRILFWNGLSKPCNPKASASPLSYVKTNHICGKPLGLRFNKKTSDLYIAYAYFGPVKVGPQGGLATSLATDAAYLKTVIDGWHGKTEQQ
ncbi:hypothetical protein RYX36_021502 [Vicia faba]